ncbi:Holliday junction resolvase MOC1, chloroplastic-like [Panicum virgatum]|uniref:Holliday junction resolvase MOC1, chloroplastic-like n=1 Tax=Panicum virgatum TaxID=38727 RepID=UPI0019D58454|nr:Holliday junction resolvase MOC1, chloroplastic-like [Panicum virgatum]
MDLLEKMVAWGILPDLQTFSGLTEHLAGAGDLKGAGAGAAVQAPARRVHVQRAGEGLLLAGARALRVFDVMRAARVTPDAPTKALPVKVCGGRGSSGRPLQWRRGARMLLPSSSAPRAAEITIAAPLVAATPVNADLSSALRLWTPPCAYEAAEGTVPRLLEDGPGGGGTLGPGPGKGGPSSTPPHGPPLPPVAVVGAADIARAAAVAVLPAVATRAAQATPPVRSSADAASPTAPAATGVGAVGAMGLLQQPLAAARAAAATQAAHGAATPAFLPWPALGMPPAARPWPQDAPPPPGPPSPWASASWPAVAAPWAAAAAASAHGVALPPGAGSTASAAAPLFPGVGAAPPLFQAAAQVID